MNRAILVAAFMSTMLLSGCFGDDDSDDFMLDDTPGEISKTEVERLEQEVLAAYPRQFSFPGQELLDPVLLLFEEVLGPGSGVGIELPNDNGPADAGGEFFSYDLAEHVPVGQPVEVRLKLKVYGNPGASTDVDIYTNVPGYQDAYDPDSFDESMNWNIVTKQKVMNTVHLDGEPFEVGVQAQNGKIVHPDGMPYELFVEIHFAEDVIAPMTPYEVIVPPNATSLIFESEPVIGDEHITSEFVIVGPDGTLLKYVEHNDIATETLRIGVRESGPHIIYAQKMHGGFLSLESDVPNPDFQVTPLTKVVTETPVASDVIAAPAPEGQSGDSGDFDTGGTFPLDVYTFIRDSGNGGVAGQIIITASSSNGAVHTTEVTGWSQSEAGRIGDRQTETVDRSQLVSGAYTWDLTGNGGAGIVVGYGVVTYER